uniref:Uncharacterized protein n=1 Tax=Chromera velia CCMP2878 TaxID=1169474 RepID=A0A0G4HIA7_9ALVE|eukprot:Cvel_6963.t1-p1 / transcript=Cvel_6963.t1 / gene=Cvel_6963 / organism=Chromera_velia_CCMP2878 / gene_product=hypothetical protein / transcript_product=hypothetical protein / location=Cvel_scaffold353:49257-49631(-) / protein_length=125 / sequence_SO=supercontig / SO=protein_coding / is_pseudo=false
MVRVHENLAEILREMLPEPHGHTHRSSLPLPPHGHRSSVQDASLPPNPTPTPQNELEDAGPEVERQKDKASKEGEEKSNLKERAVHYEDEEKKLKGEKKHRSRVRPMQAFRIWSFKCPKILQLRV